MKVKGKAKEVVGTVTGRNDMVEEGKAQQDKAEAQVQVLVQVGLGPFHLRHSDLGVGKPKRSSRAALLRVDRVLDYCASGTLRRIGCFPGRPTAGKAGDPWAYCASVIIVFTVINRRNPKRGRPCFRCVSRVLPIFVVWSYSAAFLYFRCV